MNWAEYRKIEMLGQRLNQRVQVSHKYIKIKKKNKKLFWPSRTYLRAVLSSAEFTTSEEGFQGTVMCYMYSLSLRHKDKT